MSIDHQDAFTNGATDGVRPKFALLEYNKHAEVAFW